MRPIGSEALPGTCVIASDMLSYRFSFSFFGLLSYKDVNVLSIIFIVLNKDSQAFNICSFLEFY